MNKHMQQKGSAHVVVIVVLIAALIFALGWIFWQNFIFKDNKTSDNAKPVIVKKENKKPSSDTKTYKDDATGVSFEYPSDWEVSSMDMGGSLMVTVKDNSDKPVAYLETKLSGLGGASGGATQNTLLATQTRSNGAFTCAVASKVSDAYELYYGTSTNELCAKKAGATNNGGMVYMTNDTGAAKLGMISFSNVDYLGSGKATTYTSLDSAKQFVSSDEYKQIAAMIDSLKY